VKRNDPLSLLPPDWRSELHGSDIRPVHEGMGGAKLLHVRHTTLGDLYLKICCAPDLSELRSEIERTRWLAGRGVTVPVLLRVFDDGQVGVAMMTALPGTHPGHGQQPIGDVIRALARGLLELHSLPVLDCPFEETVAARLARAREMIERKLIDAEQFADRNRRLAPKTIYDRLLQCTPATEDLVVVHGDARFDNLLVDAGGKIGFIDCGHAGRGDRYLDLEAVAADIGEHFGPEWIEAFAVHYGLKLDPAKLRFFSDLYELF
jgi:aminoglycoside 3'-phosphotransferase II